MLFRPSENAYIQASSQRGFTLLEVLVAMALIGFGLAVAFTAVSGTARLDEKMSGHFAAMALARSKLDETLASPKFAVANDLGEDRFAATESNCVQLRCSLLNSKTRFAYSTPSWNASTLMSFGARKTPSKSTR